MQGSSVVEGLAWWVTQSAVGEPGYVALSTIPLMYQNNKFMHRWIRKYWKYYHGYNYTDVKYAGWCHQTHPIIYEFINRSTSLLTKRYMCLIRKYSSIAINVWQLINTFCYLLMMSPYNTQLVRSDSAASEACEWLTERKQSGSTQSQAVEHQINYQTHFKPLWWRGTHAVTLSHRHKNTTIQNSIHLFDLALCRKLYVKDTTRILFSRTRHHGHPATALCTRIRPLQFNVMYPGM